MILIFVEHPSREMYIATKLGQKLANLLNDEIYILPVNFIYYEIFKIEKVRLIITPSSNKISWLMQQATNAPFLALNYEQMMSPINRKLKKLGLLHHELNKYISWSSEYSDYLVGQGYPYKSIIETERPQDEISHNHFFVPKDMRDYIESLGELFNKLPIVFIPLTCIQAFRTDSQLKRLSVSTGVVIGELIERREYLVSTLRTFYKYLTSQCEEILYIIRPHPGITPDMHYEFLKQEGLTLPDNVKITCEFSPYQWMANSVLMVTNYSSLALDARQLGVRTILFNPPNMPKNLHYDWMQSFDSLSDISMIGRLITNNGRTSTIRRSGVNFTERVISEYALQAESYVVNYQVETSQLYKAMWKRFMLGNLVRKIVRKLRPSQKSGVYQDYFNPFKIIPLNVSDK